MAAAIIMAWAVSMGCRAKQDQMPAAVTRPVKLAMVTAGKSQVIQSLPGKVRASRRAEMSFKVSGALQRFLVEQGQKVTQGQLMACIDPRDFDTQVKAIQSALAEARAVYRAMKTGARPEDIRMLESALAAAGAEYRFAEDQYGRSKKLWQTQYISRLEFNRHTSLRDTAKAQFEAAEQHLAKARRGARKEDLEAMASKIDGLETRLKSARDALDDTRLKAPFSGYVARRYAESHQEVVAKQPVLLLEDISTVEVVVDLPETLMARVDSESDINMAARFAVAPEQLFVLTPKEFSIHADPQTQTYQLVLTMPQPQRINILPGMTATVEHSSTGSCPAKPCIVIPAGAVTRDRENGFYIWLLNPGDMTVRKKQVEIGGLTGSDGIEILGGLTQGQQIVTAGVGRLKDGMTVSIWDHAQ